MHRDNKIDFLGENPDARNGTPQRRWLFHSLAVLTIFAIVYAGITVWVGHKDWFATLSAVSFGDIFLVLTLITAGFLIRALRWHYYTSLLGWNIPAVHRFTAFVASFAFTATPGKAGELVKGLFLRGRYNISLSQTAGILLVERLGDLLAIIVLTCGGLVVFADLRVYVLISIAIIGSIAVFSIHPTLARTVVTRLFALPKLRPFGQKLNSAFDAGRELLSGWPPIAIGGCMSLMAWVCEACAFYYLISCLGIHTNYLISFSIYGLSTLAGALSMLPGGLGGVEAVMALLLTRLGVPPSTAAIAVIMFRLLTLWLFSLIGLMFTFGWMFLLSKRGLQKRSADAK